MISAVRALVHQALGRAAEARADIAEATRAIEGVSPAHLKTHWSLFNNLTALLLVREATALLED